MAHELSGEALLKLISFIFWSSLYLACSLKAPHKSPEWCSRMVTLLHGSVSTIVGIAQCNVRTLSTYRLTSKFLMYFLKYIGEEPRKWCQGSRKFGMFTHFPEVDKQ